MTAPAAPTPATIGTPAALGPPPPVNECQARDVLDLVGDKWSLYVVSTLGGGPRRFTELRRSIDGISQRMLTVTLRGLERDGIVTRTVYEVVPPRVSYELTTLGITLLEAVLPIITWSTGNLSQINAARAEYDLRTGRAGAAPDH
jgi:DNA-binding HxlR family transcriptional regulator